jgi:hypothetical protein
VLGLISQDGLLTLCLALRDRAVLGAIVMAWRPSQIEVLFEQAISFFI